MDTCARCGQGLGIGRFCTNCGHPVDEPAGGPLDWRTDTVERPRVDVAPPARSPALPPPAADPPEAPRYPLFADEATTVREAAPPPRDIATEPPPHTHRHRRLGLAVLLPWLLGLLVLVLVAGLGAWLLLGGDDRSGNVEEAKPAGTSQEPPAEKSGEGAGRDEDRGTESPGPMPRGRPEDLAPYTTVSAPDSARPSTDLNGQTVQYVAGNLIDDSPSTAWRMPGDGTGESITFRFDDPVRLRQVGLVNGYAKTASDSRGTLDWYTGNRRVREVEWTFDDGTVVTQQLSDTRDLQTVPVGRVDTESVTMRLTAVSPPGPGRASRDYTAISAVRLVGAPLG